MLRRVVGERVGGGGGGIGTPTSWPSNGALGGAEGNGSSGVPEYFDGDLLGSGMLPECLIRIGRVVGVVGVSASEVSMHAEATSALAARFNVVGKWDVVARRCNATDEGEAIEYTPCTNSDCVALVGVWPLEVEAPGVAGCILSSVDDVASTSTTRYSK